MGAGSAPAKVVGLKKLMAIHPIQDTPKFLALGFKIPGGSVEKIKNIEARSSERFQYIEGKQSLTSIKKLEPADIITVLMGKYTYSKRPCLYILKSYLRILKPGGTIFIYSFGGYSDLFPWLRKQSDLTFRVSSQKGLIIHRKR